MYTLRKVTEHQTYNENLGEGYSVVSKEFNHEDFKHYYRSVFKKEYDPKNDEGIVKFIITNIVIPVYETETVYIMTESGKTFEKINSAK